MLALPLPAQAAATATTRMANFTAGPATVVKGKTISVAAQSQRAAGKVWAKTGAVTATVYFDPDGTAPNKAVRTVKSNASGYVSVALPATVWMSPSKFRPISDGSAMVYHRHPR